MFDKFWKQFLVEEDETFVGTELEPQPTFVMDPDDATEEPQQRKKDKKLFGFEAWLDNNGYYMEDFLGRGQHGAVYDVLRKKGGRKDAAKVVYYPKSGQRVRTNPEREVKNYKFMSKSKTGLFPRVYFADIVQVPIHGQPIDGEKEPAAVIIMEKLVPLPEDLARKLFASSGYRKGSAMTQRDYRLFSNKTILKNFVEQILKDYGVVRDANISKISDYVVKNYGNRRVSPSQLSLVSSERRGKRTFSNFGIRILAFILDGLLIFEEGINLIQKRNKQNALTDERFTDSSGQEVPVQQVNRFLKMFESLLYKNFNNNYSRPLIATDTNVKPSSVYSGFEIFDSDNVIPTLFPEADKLKSLVTKIEKMGISFKDVHSDNVMMRPGTNEIVIADLGSFNTPTQKITENKKKQAASCIIFDNKDRILIIRRSKTDDWKPGWWDTPGGHIEDGEIPVEAATREADEESGLTVRNLVQVETKHFSDTIKHFFTTRDYDGVVYFRKNPETGFIEHDDYRWVTFEQLKDIQKSIIPLSVVKRALHLA